MIELNDIDMDSTYIEVIGIRYTIGRSFIYFVLEFVERNNTHDATIVVATTVNTTWVFQPACTSAARRL